MSASVPSKPQSAPAPPSDAPRDDQLLDIIFGRVPMGIAVCDRDTRLQRCNQTWVEFFVQYLGVPAEYVTPGKTLYELIPGNDEAQNRLIERALAGDVVSQTGNRLETADVVTYWDVVLAPIFSGAEVVGFVNLVTDATDRVNAYELLQQRIAAFALVAESMTVDQPIGVTLRSLAQTAAQAARAEACAIIIVDAVTHQLTLFEAAGLSTEYAAALADWWRRGEKTPTRDALERQELLIATGARARGLANPLYEPLHRYLEEATWDDIVVVPLDSRGRYLGVMQYYHRAGREHDDEERAFLAALADQAAVAMANAELYARSEHDAANLERQRLARELHDSVSQALFSMTLHARTAERQLTSAGLDQDAPAATTVRRLAELTQGALAEMRALIFELRPQALAEEGLVTALTRQAAALSAREGVPIEVIGPHARPALEPTMEEHLYRLTLEALNNAVQHAEPTRIAVEVMKLDDRLTVTISDDGVGFDPVRPHPGHLGQSTMAERASAIGATLIIDSSPGTGCTVTVIQPLAG
ncbi:histidine kinase [Intrasporangium sp.]|jgi:signal transduction histidine kinase|uniref:PAS domain-containing sensor histidine kinase n=1 Tax=Intrasporangium sp. TaxID=1925024 RepID=UPI0033653530